MFLQNFIKIFQTIKELWAFFTNCPGTKSSQTDLGHNLRKLTGDKQLHQLSENVGQKIPWTKDPMNKRSQASFYRVDKTSHTDLTGWTKDPILIFYPGQNIPCLFVNLDKRSRSVKWHQFSTRTNTIIDQRSFGLIRPNFPN